MTRPPRHARVGWRAAAVAFQAGLLGLYAFAPANSTPGAADSQVASAVIGAGAPAATGSPSVATVAAAEDGVADMVAIGSNPGDWPLRRPTTSGATDATLQTTPTQTPTVQAQAVAKTLTIEPGTYILWKKDKNIVLLVRDSKLVRAMPTTDLDWKTPVGTYHVDYKQRVGAESVEGVAYRLPYYVQYGPVPQRTSIGFHQVPVTSQGRYIQPLASVGLPGYASHGCERLLPADAKALWDFADIGTEVRVR